MPHPDSEDSLVEQPAMSLLADLGWATLSAAEEVLGSAGTLGRANTRQVVLPGRLRAALATLNPTLPAEAVELALEALMRDRSAMGSAAANREVYALLRDGVPVSVPDAANGGMRTERARVIDWEHPESNDFLAVRQLTIRGPLYTRRPDIVAFVNGLPLVVLEFKKPGVPARRAFDDNLTSYKADLPALAAMNALLIASNGTDSRVGSLTADWERFFEWKRIASEEEPRRVSLEVMLRGVCDRARLLDLIENFTLFSDPPGGTAKIVGQNHQFIGVNRAIATALEARAAGHGRGGVFWQTQGSGKSYSMVFFSQKILRRVPGDWTFVIVTDRVDLDDQIAKTFKACGVVSDSDHCHAESGAHLRELLRGNRRYVFSIINKFKDAGELSTRRDIIVITDEAHRSQYDTLAMDMRAALPHATFVAFTGTPLIAGEERTREVFGDYVSVYDFRQSVEDGATVPLYYENRTPELHLENPSLNEDIYQIIESAELDEAGEAKLQKELGRQYHLLTRDDRLEAVAKDIVSHFLGRGFQGKAMVVSLDKVTTLRMHAKVRAHWDAERTRVKAEQAALIKIITRERTDAERARLAELHERLARLDGTDMAVVVSAEQNELERMAKLGLDIAPHRKRMVDESLDEKFKDPKDPLRLVFVCAMWLTGFDAPSCSTVYLDKPMRNHTLMQTIARANRVYPGKQSGLIVDYANVFASLEKALALYGAGTAGGETPVRDKAELVAQLRAAVADAKKFCAARTADIDAITAASGLTRLSLLSDAVNALIAPEATRKEFYAHERLVRALYQAVKPDRAAIEFAPAASVLAILAEELKNQTGEGGSPDISGVMAQVNTLLDESIGAKGFSIEEGAAGARHGVIDLSAVNFEALAEKFKTSKRKNIELEQLKAAIRACLDKIIRFNRTRIDFQKKFEELIASYNAGSRNLDELFEELVKFSRELTAEESRHVRENLSADELVIFDILTRPAPALSDAERDAVKQVARLLLERITGLLTLDWQKQARARAKVELEIKTTLGDGLPPAYDDTLYETKVAEVYDYLRETA